MTWLWILLLVSVSALALLPFVHRAWSRRRATAAIAERAGGAEHADTGVDDVEVDEVPHGEPSAPDLVEGAAQDVSGKVVSAPSDDQARDDAPVQEKSDPPAPAPSGDEAPPRDESDRSSPRPEVPARSSDSPDTPDTPPSMGRRLGKARRAMAGFVEGLRSRTVEDGTWEEIEEALIAADVGVHTTLDAVERLRHAAAEQGIRDGSQLLDALKEQMVADLAADRSLRRDHGEGVPVWLFVGVNGVGKTTTIGKVGQRLTGQGVSVLMAAGDTFRAAAAEQLTTWAERCGADIVRGSEGADPSSVIFDGIQAARARELDVVLADTAGRLQNKVNLMEELAKVRRVADREPGSVQEVLLVIDATTGQNGLSQAKQFAEAVDVSGVVLTKLDGSARGGIVFAIERELGIPVKLVGLGESAADLVDFEPREFVEALFAKDAS